MDSGTSLPRRRSCDRCYAHKVRCIRVSKDGTRQTGDQNDTLPCLRCTRSGARCMYSPQRKSGRPPLLTQSQSVSSPNPTAGNPLRLDRKRSPSSHTPNSAQPISLTSTDDNATFNTESVNYDALSTWLEEGNIPFPDTSTDNTSIGEDPEADDSFLGYLGTISEFSMSPREQFDVAAQGIDDNSYFNALNASVNTSVDHGQHFGLTPNVPEKKMETTPSQSNVEVIIRELTETNLRILRSVESTSISTAAPLTVTSPVMNELFGATNSLISIIDQIINRPRRSATKNLDTDRHWLAQFYSPQNAQSVPLEDGTILMALSCHQQLLAAFDRIYSSLHRHLALLQAPSSGSLDQQSLACSFTAQAVMIVKLLKHLTSQLDRALAPIAKPEKILGNSDEGRHLPILSRGGQPTTWEGQTTNRGLSSSSSDSDVSSTTAFSPNTQDQTTAGATEAERLTDTAEKLEFNRSFDLQYQSRYSDIATARLVCEAMKRRRVRLHGHIKGVKALTKLSSVS